MNTVDTHGACDGDRRESQTNRQLATCEGLPFSRVERWVIMMAGQAADKR